MLRVRAIFLGKKSTLLNNYRSGQLPQGGKRHGTVQGSAMASLHGGRHLQKKERFLRGTRCPDFVLDINIPVLPSRAILWLLCANP